MKTIKHLNEIEEFLKQKAEKKTLAVAMGEDPHTIGAVTRALNKDLLNVVVTGQKSKIHQIADEKGLDISQLKIINVDSETEGIKKAVKLVKDGEADFLMKGLCNTSKYMRGILDKKNGLMTKGEILSHVTIMEVPSYHKLLLLSDVAVIPYPDLSDKIKMLNYCKQISNSLGIDLPKAAILAAVEKVNPKMQCTQDAAILSKMQDRKQIKGMLVDGPLAMDLAVSKESVAIKGIKSEVAGDADIVLFPNIEAGNIVYKTLAYLGNAKLAAIVMGAQVPCVLTSRSDSDESKFYSIILGALVA